MNNFSYERFYINVLIRLLKGIGSSYEHRRYPARFSFDYYFDKLTRKKFTDDGFKCVPLHM